MRTFYAPLLFVTLLGGALPARGQSFNFSTGSPDGKIATASRPDAPDKIEIETGDDFVLSASTRIQSATFTGLIPLGTPLSNVNALTVEIYRTFPKDSQNPPSGKVPTRDNSPSDVAFEARDLASGGLTFSTTILNSSFTAANSVVNGINPSPNQFTGGEGPVTGQEVLFTVNFSSPFDLPADHYFFVPQVGLTGADNFLWLSAPKPIGADGTPFNPDLQSWIRDENLAPDWLRVGHGHHASGSVQRSVLSAGHCHPGTRQRRAVHRYGNCRHLRSPQEAP